MSKFPTPCEANFTKVAEDDPTELIAWIHSGGLNDAHLTFALETLGSVYRVSDDQVKLAIEACLIEHVTRPKGIGAFKGNLVVEGAILGLSMCSPNVCRKYMTWLLANHPSKMIKELAKEVLEDL